MPPTYLMIGRKLADHKIIRFPSKYIDGIIKTMPSRDGKESGHRKIIRP